MSGLVKTIGLPPIPGQVEKKVNEGIPEGLVEPCPAFGRWVGFRAATQGKQNARPAHGRRFLATP